ncbi:MAG TPA: cbb3-type cytochrome c oxidase N-terminal domain-containing protein [Myxococcota bacterium]|nr:cbb3-type cytochrome c oxidase N-terminal domain-containing protein [Myxococcota bacterium]
MSETRDELLDHNYDAIQEYDNPMPGWWKGLFWGTFFFSCAYLLHFHLGGDGDSVDMEYTKAVQAQASARSQEALAAGEVNEADLDRLTHDAALMAAAGQKFAQVCATCHGATGAGLRAC